MLLVRDISYFEQLVRDENNKSRMSIPDIGEKTVISIVLQLLKTISDGYHLDIQRFLRSPNAGWFSHFATTPLTTRYHSVSIGNHMISSAIWNK